MSQGNKEQGEEEEGGRKRQKKQGRKEEDMETQKTRGKRTIYI